MHWWDAVACAAALLSLAGSFATGWHLAQRRARRLLARRHHEIREQVEVDAEYAMEADFDD
jgi:hypothetical protein